MGPAGHGQCLERSRRDRGRGKIFRARRALAGWSLIPAEDREEDGRHREPRGQGGRAAGWLLRARRGAWAQGPQAEVGGAAALASGRCAPCEPPHREAVITRSVLWAESQGRLGRCLLSPVNQELMRKVAAAAAEKLGPWCCRMQPPAAACRGHRQFLRARGLAHAFRAAPQPVRPCVWPVLPPPSGG